MTCLKQLLVGALALGTLTVGCRRSEYSESPPPRAEPARSADLPASGTSGANSNSELSNSNSNLAPSTGEGLSTASDSPSAGVGTEQGTDNSMATESELGIGGSGHDKAKADGGY